MIKTTIIATPLDRLQKAELIASDLTLEEMQAQIGSEGPRMPEMEGE